MIGVLLDGHLQNWFGQRGLEGVSNLPAADVAAGAPRQDSLGRAGSAAAGHDGKSRHPGGVDSRQGEQQGSALWGVGAKTPGITKQVC